jgi:hypothetical protein
MTWKVYATISGATVLAGWLASAPPAKAPSPALSPPGSQPAAAASDIEREATRLQARVRREAIYAQPQRNPFRFSAGRSIAIPPRDVPEPRRPDDTLAPAVPAPPPPTVSLSGIAEDQGGQRLERTAILSSPAGVLLVHEGDDVLGQYRVTKVESEAVELVKLSDGTTVRLSLKSTNAQ